jgi:hypothetical protein
LQTLQSKDALLAHTLIQFAHHVSRYNTTPSKPTRALPTSARDAKHSDLLCIFCDDDQV